MHAVVDKLSEQDIVEFTASGELLAKLLAEHTIAQAEEGRKRNKAALGLDLPYVIEVNATLVPQMPDMSGPAVRALIDELDDAIEKGASRRGTIKVTITYQIPPELQAILFPYSVIVSPVIATYRTLWKSIGGRFIIRGIDKAIYHELRRRDPNDVLTWIANELRNSSPVLTGTYRDAFALYANGLMIADAESVAKGDADIPDAKRYTFINRTPYARRLEVGRRDDGGDFVQQVPSHIVERVAIAARSRFNDARIIYGFVPLSEEALRDQSGRRRINDRIRSRRSRGGSQMSSPAISVELR